MWVRVWLGPEVEGKFPSNHNSKWRYIAVKDNLLSQPHATKSIFNTAVNFFHCD